MLLHNVGILWIDALCRWYRDHRERFQSEVLLPLAIAAAVSCVVSIYQGYVDLTFLNTGFWAYMIRAGGTLGDPNKLGAMAAFWTVGSLVLAKQAGTTRAFLIGGRGNAARHCRSVAVGIPNWPGARLLVSLPIAAFEGDARVAILAWRGALVSGRVAAVTGAMLAVAVLLIVALRFSNTHTIAARGTLGYLPFFGDRGIAASANELLWERFGYGPAAIEMVRNIRSMASASACSIPWSTISPRFAATRVRTRFPPTTHRTGSVTTSPSSASSAAFLSCGGVYCSRYAMFSAATWR